MIGIAKRMGLTLADNTFRMTYRGLPNVSL